jgi:hypothetical protein
MTQPNSALQSLTRYLLALALLLSAFATGSPVQAQPGSTLRGFWAFEDNLLDSSSYQNNGSGTAPRFGQGINGQALLRNGNELPIQILPQYGNGGSLNLSDSAVTIEAWVKSSNWLDFFRHIIDNVDGYALSVLDGRLAMLGPEGWWDPIGTTGPVGETLTNPLLSLNTWHYVVGTYDRSRQKLYIDGQLVAYRETSASVPSGTGSIGIGGWGGIGPDYLFNGTIDNLRVFSYARSFAEIQTDYGNPPSGGGSSNVRPPVIFIPGIGGTEFRNIQNSSEQLLWIDVSKLLSVDDAFLDVMQLDAIGAQPLYPNPEYQTVRITKVIDTIANVYGVYQPFINFMQDPALQLLYGLEPYRLGEVGNVATDSSNQVNHVVDYDTGENFWLFPVDFRKDLAGQADRLDVLINDVLAATGASQVNLVGHSQGGLVIRAYIADSARSSKVSKVVTLGTPYLGSPNGFHGLRYGLDFIDQPFIKMNPAESKKLVQNWPGALELLPANKTYFDVVTADNPHPRQYRNHGYFAVNRDVNLADGDTRAPGQITSWSAMQQILTAPNIADYPTFYQEDGNQYSWIVPAYNGALINQAASFQTTGIAAWENSTVNRSVIASTGLCTEGWYDEVWVTRNGQTVEPKVTVRPTRGDGTVPLLSANMGQGLPPSVVGTANVYYAWGHAHQGLPNDFASQVVAILNDKSLALVPGTPGLGQLSASQPTQRTTCRTLTILSPADIHLYDGNGLHTGRVNGVDAEELVPGTAFFNFSYNQVILAPSTVPYTLTVNGTGTGLFDLLWQDWEDSDPIRTILYQDVPVTPNTQTRLEIVSGPVPALQVDADGDGIFETTVNAASVVETGEALDDAHPPTTTIQVDGTSVPGGYAPGVTVTLNATDNADGVGVLKTVYSLDEGQTFQTYTGPLTITGKGTWTILAQSTDRVGNRETPLATASVTIVNVPPTISTITGPVDPVSVNTALTASANFSDLGDAAPHTAVWEWGDGTSSAGNVTEANGTGTVTSNHTYTAAGVYTVRVMVADSDGSSSQSNFQYVVVYDPNGGFVTGGGWINSPAEAYTPNPTLTGKANFGFVSKYQNGAGVPTGNTQFNFKVANLNFQSTSYQWLVVAGAKAQFKGSGTINGAGDYDFMLTAIDGQVNGGGGVDKFRIRIWDRVSGGIVYDNQMGASDTANPSTAIGGGSIVIHK